MLYILLILAAVALPLDSETKQAVRQGVLPLALGILAAFDALTWRSSKGSLLRAWVAAASRPLGGLCAGLIACVFLAPDRAFVALLGILLAIPYYAAVGTLANRLLGRFGPACASALFAGLFLVPGAAPVHPVILLDWALIPRYGICGTCNRGTLDALFMLGGLLGGGATALMLVLGRVRRSPEPLE